MRPYALATIELYGIGEVRPIDIPLWRVSERRPRGDGTAATWGFTIYCCDDSENTLFNSDVRYYAAEFSVFQSTQKSTVLVGSRFEGYRGWVGGNTLRKPRAQSQWIKVNICPPPERF